MIQCNADTTKHLSTHPSPSPLIRSRPLPVQNPRTRRQRCPGTNGDQIPQARVDPPNELNGLHDGLLITVSGGEGPRASASRHDENFEILGRGREGVRGDDGLGKVRAGGVHGEELRADGGVVVREDGEGEVLGEGEHVEGVEGAEDVEGLEGWEDDDAVFGRGWLLLGVGE